jgi:hypothetical protein
MFYVNVNNNYPLDVSINGAISVPTGRTGSTGRTSGLQTVAVPWMGTVLVLDLGQQMVPGYPLKETWGVLLRYAELELYYRYEGDGEIDLAVDQYGNINVTGVQGSAMIISMPELTYRPAGVQAKS